jgi:hypothetical protein
MWDRRASITSIHDGDTVAVLLDQGFGDLKEAMKIRLFGVFAPELKEVGGPECKDFVDTWVNKYTGSVRFPFIVTTLRGPKSGKEISSLERYVAVIETMDHSHNLNTEVQAFITASGFGGGVGA